MASAKSTELSATEIELKRRGRRRLIGAITIGLLGVVFLPMIFDSEPKRNVSGTAAKKQEISVQVPAKEGQPPLPTPSAAQTTSAPQPKAVAEVVKSTPPEVAVVGPAPSAAKSAPAATVAKSDKTAPAAKSQAGAVDRQGFVVQLGVYGDLDNANQTIAKMKEAKLPVYTESIPIKSGTATRVRVGPFPTREKADSALARIKLAGGDGKIVPLQ